MPNTRRQFMQSTAAAAAATILTTPRGAFADEGHDFKAVAFDAFTVFDPQSVAAAAEELFPGKGAELSKAWRTRQFEYTWLRTLTGRYADFWTVTRDALVYAAKLVKLDVDPAKRDRLMDAFLHLKGYADSAPALRAMKDAGLRLAFLSNMTPKMLDAATKSAGLDGLFDHALSTDAVRAYKPDPRAYQMGIEALGLKKEQIAFAAFGGWDAAGAKSFGYMTFWVNRLNLPVEELGVAPDGTGADLNALAMFLKAPPR